MLIPSVILLRYCNTLLSKARTYMSFTLTVDEMGTHNTILSIDPIFINVRAVDKIMTRVCSLV